MSKALNTLTLAQAMESLSVQSGLALPCVDILLDHQGHFIGTLSNDILISDKQCLFQQALTQGYEKSFQQWFLKSLPSLRERLSQSITISFPCRLSIGSTYEGFGLSNEDLWVFSELSILPNWLSNTLREQFNAELAQKRSSTNQEASINSINHSQTGSASGESKSFYRLRCRRVEERFKQALYVSQNTTRFGLKHDLANRMFLFKALPQMLDFAEPHELLNDVLAELPNLMSFLEERLAPKYSESIPLTWYTNTQSLFDGFDEMSQLNSLSTLYQFECSQAFVREAEQSDQFAKKVCFLGLEWSLLYLSSLNKHLLKASQLKKAQAKPISCTLQPLDQAQINLNELLHGDCGRLLPDQAQYCLSLCFDEAQDVDFDQVLKHWKVLSFDSNHSLGIARNLEKDQSWALWLETWLYACHLLKGIVKVLNPHKIAIIF